MPQYDINLREYSRILRKRKFVVVLTTLALGIFSTAFAVFKAPTPIYTSACSIKFEKETTVEGLYARTISWSQGDDIETQLSIINSYSVLEKVAERLGLIPKTDVPPDSPLKADVVQVVDDLHSKVEVSRENFTNILNIKVKDADPTLAQRLANAIAVTYRDQHSANQMKRMTDAIKYITDQLASVGEKLRESEEAFNKFSQENQLLSLDLQSENLLARVHEIQNEIRKEEEAKSELQAIMDSLRRFVQDPSLPGQSFYSAKASSQYQATNDALVGLQLKKDSLLEDYTPQHPEVVEVNRKIIENARKMGLLLQAQVREIEKRQAEERKELGEFDRKTNVLMQNKLEYDRLKRRVALYNDMTTLLEQKNQEALIKKAEKPEEITIVRPALLPTQPINPPRVATTGVMGLLIGLVLGMVFAFVAETFDTSLGAIEDVEQTLNTQVLGILPQADPKDIQESLRERFPEGGKAATSMQNINLIAHFSPTTMIVESFRALRTNIQFKDAEKNLKTLAITSTSPQEGKTFVSTNLAITMAQGGVKTLLVGADMRKPMLDRVFGVDMVPGLSDILLGNYPWRDTVKTVTDLIIGKLTLDEVMMTPGLDNLHLITSGTIPPNPAELIDSKRLRSFIEEAEKDYDLIIFDSPPILSTADAVILASKVAGVLLVYRVGSVSRGLLKRATTQLEQVKCNIVGVILNGMKPHLSPDFQDFKNYKYYSSYSAGGDARDGGERKKGFWPFKKEHPSRKVTEGKIPGSGIANGRPQKSQGKRFSLLGALFIIVALALLAGGILWQNGIIDPMKLRDFKKWGDKGAAPVFKRGLERPKAKAVIPEPKPVPPVASGQLHVEKPRPDVPLPVPPSQPEPKEDVVPERETAFPSTGAEGLEKPEMATVTPIPISQLPAVPAQPPAEERATVETATASSEPVSYPYSLYLGSYQPLEQAKRAVEIYRKKGLDPYWARVDFEEKGLWFRVFAGHFRDQNEAERFVLERGVKEAEVKKTEYANLIGVYTKAGEVKSQAARLSELGYAPYRVMDHEGKTRLYVGAYVTEEGAKRQSQDLKSDGIESRVVGR
ncbi:MAG: SPOR domain-containing protein [Desulfobacterales bacterium]|nr:SPOR domain-containing protein [Desulfobacterales bacterium]